MRDEILRLLDRRDRLRGKGEALGWIMAALELLLRAELQRQARRD